MTEPAVVDITKPIALEVTKRINSMWYADMEIEFNDYIQPECYVEFNNTFYISKTINKSMYKGRKTFKVRLEHGMTELNDFGIGPFTWTGKTCAEMAALALAGTTWSVGTVSGLSGTKTVKSDKRITVLAALNLIVNAFYGELDFHALHLSDGSFQRTVDIKNEIGSQTKVQIRYDKNSDIMERREDTTKLCTRLYIFGKDNLTISSVNAGLAYLDSANIGNYPHPKETAIYTNIDVVATLLAYAQIYLGAYDDPLYTYNINTMDKSIFPTWSSEAIDLGDSLRVYNSDLGINVDVRVKQVIHDLVNPDKIRMELANFIDRITDLLSDLDKAIKENTYENAPDTFIPVEELSGYEDIPITNIGTLIEGAEGWAGSIRNPNVRKMVVDSSGNIYCAYRHTDGVSVQIYVARSTNGGITWTPTKVSDNVGDAAECHDAAMAIDSNDNVFVVWYEVNNSLPYPPDNIWFNKYSNGVWGVPAALEFGPGLYSNYMQLPTIAIDSNDTIHVIALSTYGTGYIRHIKSIDGGINWSSYVEVYHGQVVAVDNGIALEVSRDNDILHLAFIAMPVGGGGITKVYYLNSIDSGATWGNLTILSNDISHNAKQISLATNSVGSLHFVWVEESSSSQYDVYYNNCIGAVWGTPIILSDQLYDSLSCSLSIDKGDHIYVAWTESVDISGNRQLMLRVYQADIWHEVVIRTTNPISKQWLTMVHANFPIINGVRPCILNNGFALMYEEYLSVSTQNIKFWIDCQWQ